VANPSYSGNRDQEDHSLKPAQSTISTRLSQKLFTKIGLVVWLKVKALSSCPSTKTTTTTKNVGKDTRKKEHTAGGNVR
jgi:hypothetical protein